MIHLSIYITEYFKTPFNVELMCVRRPGCRYMALCLCVFLGAQNVVLVSALQLGYGYF